MIIMLEGPDLAGKTTLAKKLKKFVKGSTVVHRGPPELPDPFGEYLTPLEEMYHSDGSFILDRWHWGERVYGPIVRKKDMFSNPSFEYLEMACERYGVYRVLRLPSVATLRQRWDEHGDDFIDASQHVDVIDAYTSMKRGSGGVTVDRMLEMDDVNKTVAARVVSEAFFRERCSRHLDCWTSYIGPYTPKVLFVGEAPAITRRGNHTTAFTPYRGSSGEYLMYALSAVNFKRTVGTFGFCNALTEGEGKLDTLIDQLDEPRVVALGAVAHDALDDINRVHGRTPHPQFARRFHNREFVSYGSALVRAAQGEDMRTWRG
jgi:hypothetical protein